MCLERKKERKKRKRKKKERKRQGITDRKMAKYEYDKRKAKASD